MSKFSLDVLRQSVYPFTASDDPDVIRGAEFGQDVSLTKVGNEILVSHVDPIVGAMKGIGSLAVHVACNDIATSGVPPRWILLLVMLPSKEDTEQLESIMQEAQQAANDVGASIIGGHTGYSSGVTRPLVAVTALGKSNGRRVLGSDGAQVGDHVLVTKGVGLEGTAILAADFTEIALTLDISQEEIAQARSLENEVSVLPEALLLADEGATSMHDVTRGGLLETLLEISMLSQVGLDIQVDRIPIWPQVARFADAFEFDPLRMISSGTLMATVPHECVDSAIASVEEIGVGVTDIGRAIDKNGVHLHHRGEIQVFSEPSPEKDELARMWDLYPREV